MNPTLAVLLGLVIARAAANLVRVIDGLSKYSVCYDSRGTGVGFDPHVSMNMGQFTCILLLTFTRKNTNLIEATHNQYTMNQAVSCFSPPQHTVWGSLIAALSWAFSLALPFLVVAWLHGHDRM